MEIEVIDMFSGIGTLSYAITKGLEAANQTVRIQAGIDNHKGYLEFWEEHHKESSTVCGDIAKLHPAELSFPKKAHTIRLLSAGIPCTGHSGFGISKNKLKGRPESHKSAGHLFIVVGNYIMQHKPEFIILENVVGYKESIAGKALKKLLSRLGYFFQEGCVYPNNEFNTPTTRPRWYLIASKTHLINWQFKAQPFDGNMASVLDNPEEVDEREIFTKERMEAHQNHIARKQQEGCNFSQTILKPSDRKCPTIPRTYYKIQPAGPFVQAGSTYRMLRPHEIAKMHGFPPSVPIPSSRRLAIEGFGQGVCYKPFFEMGRYIGNLLT